MFFLTKMKGSNDVLEIPTEVSWSCSEGAHSATFYECKEINKYTEKGEERYVRLIFQPEQLSAENAIVLVGRNFVPTLKKGGDLRLFLDTWLGRSVRGSTPAGREVRLRGAA